VKKCADVLIWNTETFFASICMNWKSAKLTFFQSSNFQIFKFSN